MSVQILIGDCRDVLRTLPDESVHCVVTSPPYWGLRDYGTGAAGIGLEETVDEHMDALVSTFDEVRRVLRSDGTLWFNYGDAYAGSWGAQGRGDKRSEMEIGGRIEGYGRKTLSEQQIIAHPKRAQTGSVKRTNGCKPKDLMGLPWALAFALRDSGWWLRQEIIWHKPNPMPESIRDRCTKAHEHLFLLSKSDRYHFDADAIAEDRASAGGSWENGWATGDTPHTALAHSRDKGDAKTFRGGGKYTAGRERSPDPVDRASHGNVQASSEKRNKRSVWTIATQAFPEAHFATFPPALIEPCILAGCPEGGTVLDPFGGAGTTGLVADRLGRNSILIELNESYAEMAKRRIDQDSGMFGRVELIRPARTQSSLPAQGSEQPCRDDSVPLPLSEVGGANG